MASRTLKYFAYASNLFKERVIHTLGRDSSARILGAAKLKDYDLCFDYYSEEWKGCKATIRFAPGQSTWGLLWQVTDEDRVKLAWAEEVHLGKYCEINAGVTTPDGLSHSCFLYQLGETMDPNGKPSPQYKDVIIRGATQAGLPQDYIDALKLKEDNGFSGDVKIYLEILSSVSQDN